MTKKLKNHKTQGYEAQSKQLQKELKKQTIYQLKCESWGYYIHAKPKKTRASAWQFFTSTVINKLSSMVIKNSRNLAKKLKESGKKTQGFGKKLKVMRPCRA